MSQGDILKVLERTKEPMTSTELKEKIGRSAVKCLKRLRFYKEVHYKEMYFGNQKLFIYWTKETSLEID